MEDGLPIVLPCKDRVHDLVFHEFALSRSEFDIELTAVVLFSISISWLTTSSPAISNLLDQAAMNIIS
jgi:hypothetical protein